MNTIIEKIKEELRQNADEQWKKKQQHFFREPIRLYGLKNQITEKIAKKYLKEIPCKEKPELFNLCEILWQSGTFEEAFIACHWSYYLHKRYTADDFNIFDRWVKSYISNWAVCDAFCNHTVGTFIEMYPEYVKELKKWCLSDNRWVKRASAVSLILPARKGKFLDDVLEIAEILLTDWDDMVQKGYGWMLKEASKPFQKEVFEFVIKNKAIMPRTALRYAIEKMPGDLRITAMQK